MMLRFFSQRRGFEFFFKFDNFLHFFSPKKNCCFYFAAQRYLSFFFTLNLLLFFFLLRLWNGKVWRGCWRSQPFFCCVWNTFVVQKIFLFNFFQNISFSSGTFFFPENWDWNSGRPTEGKNWKTCLRFSECASRVWIQKRKLVLVVFESLLVKL